MSAKYDPDFDARMTGALAVLGIGSLVTGVVVLFGWGWAAVVAGVLLLATAMSPNR